MTAKMVPVLEVTDAMLESSTVPENDFAAWDAGTTYAASTDSVPVKVIKNHKIWESLQGSNTGNDPETSPDWWVELLPTNRWSVFDLSIQNQAVQATSMNWVIRPGENITSVSLFNLVATSVTIVVTDDTDGEVYNETFSLIDNSGVTDAFEYWFSPIVQKGNLTVTDIPPYSTAEISITVTAGTGDAKLGQIAMGFAEALGDTLNEVPLGINDYTRLNEDQFGRTSPVVRGYARTATPAIAVNTERVRYLEKRIAERRGMVTVWLFDTQYEDNELAYMGYFRQMNFLYRHASKTILDLDIRSLV